MQRLKMLYGPMVIILIAILCIYTKVLNFDFISTWDDDVYVINNKIIKEISKDNIKSIFQSDTGANYHPLTLLSLALDYQLYELDSRGYHLSNVILHILNAFLVFIFIFYLSRKDRFVAFVSSLFFAIHPMHIESVAWVSERKDVLFTFFLLLGLVNYLKYLEKKKWLFYLITLLFAVLAMLSKPTAVVFPILLFLLDYYENRKDIKWVIIEKLPFLFCSFLMGFTTLGIQSAYNALHKIEYYNIIDRLFFASNNTLQYLYKFFFPFVQKGFYPYPPIGESLPISIYISPLLLLILMGVIFYLNNKRKYIGFGFLFFITSIALMLQIIPAGSSMIAERYTYLPYIGLCFIFGMLTKELLEKHKNITYLILGLYFIIIDSLSFNRVDVWKNDITFWNDLINKKVVTHKAYASLGVYHYRNNEWNEAMEMYDRSLTEFPDYSFALINRGELLAQNNEWEKSINDFSKALVIEPLNSELYNLRGASYYHLNLLEEALSDYERGLSINDDHAGIYLNRGVLYASRNELNEAIQDFNKVLELEPESSDALYNRSIMYCKLKKYNKAINDLNLAITLLENEGSYYHMRAFAYYKLEKLDQAKKDAIVAKRLGVILSDYLEELILENK